jgi:hypothetical protein
MTELTSHLPAASDQDMANHASSPLTQHLLLRAEDVDTIGKSIAFLVQEVLLNGFDSISHADLAARIELILKAMPSARPIILAMQFSIFEENYAEALSYAHLLIEREGELMELARARQAQGSSHP